MYKNAYGKRPLWQWILFYLLIGFIAYGLVYYFVFARKGYDGNPNMSNAPQSQRSIY